MFEIDHIFTTGDVVYTIDPISFTILKGKVEGVVLTSYSRYGTLTTIVSYFVVYVAKNTGAFVDEVNLFATFEDALTHLYPQPLTPPTPTPT